MPESNESHREYPKDQAATETKPKTYTVDSGDNLSAIAKQELGDANRWREIYELNKEVIGDNPDLIQPGMELKLPS
ncbi:MAG: LysM peptidoglycan-binding domain-containing protein [Chloroflexi bacterium]|nr:MAG: LysM peptidoglycan-binding domain-containing protein [Chloroflexota bacterium]